MSMMYDLGERVFNFDYSTFLKKDLEQTIEDGKAIKGFFKKGVATSYTYGAYTLPIISNLLEKGAIYAISGNLSRSLQERIQEELGKEKFNAVCASEISTQLNAFLYLYGASSEANLPDSIRFLSFLSLVLETGYRVVHINPADNSKPVPCGSFIGKILSLPAEFTLGVYDTIKRKRLKKKSKEKSE